MHFVSIYVSSSFCLSSRESKHARFRTNVLRRIREGLWRSFLWKEPHWMIYYSADLDSASPFHLAFFPLFSLSSIVLPVIGVSSGFTLFLSFEFYGRSRDIVARSVFQADTLNPPEFIQRHRKISRYRKSHYVYTMISLKTQSNICIFFNINFRMCLYNIILESSLTNR